MKSKNTKFNNNLKIYLLLFLSVGVSLSAQLPPGYGPKPSTTAISFNGDFSNIGGTTEIAGVVKPNSPATTVGSTNPALQIKSQATFLPNGGYRTDAQTSSNYNTYSIMSGTKAAGFPFTGALLNSFPGDPANNVAAATNYLYSNGNVFPSQEYIIWEQTLNNLVAGRWYTFSMYVNNAIEPPTNTPDDPVVRLKLGGTSGLPNGTTVAGPTTLTEAATGSSQPMGGWIRVEHTFQATATTQIFKVTSAASGTWGDDFQMTQVNVVEYAPILNATSNAPVCLGSTLTLTASTPATGAMTYSWTGPDGFTSSLPNPTRPNMQSSFYGDYVVTITDAAGASRTETVTVLQPPAHDTDGDGINDYCDLDDDNDGILDAIEGRCATEAFEGFDSPLNNNITNGAGQNRGTTFKGWTTQNGTRIMTIRVNGTSYTPGPDNAQSGTQYIDMNNAGDYMYKTLTFSKPVVINASAYFNNRDTQANNYVPWTGFIQITSDTSTSPTVLAAGNNVNFVKAEGNDGPWKQSSITNFKLAAGTYRIRVYISDFGHMDTIYYCASTDTDGDGTPDYLDADSDGDGCSDVIEGGANFVQGASYITNNALNTIVNANGVPAIPAGTTGYDQTNGQTANQSTTFNLAAVAGSAAANETICWNTIPSALSLSGSTGTIQWQSSTNNTTFTNIAGGTSATYAPGALTQTMYYRAIVTSAGGCFVISNVVTKSVNNCIDAVNDTLGNIATGTTSAINLITNDKNNSGTAAVIGTGAGQVSISTATNATGTSGAWPAGFTLNANGTITVAAGTAAGPYTLYYTICNQTAGTPCDTAAVTLTVIPTVQADDDAFAATATQGISGATLGNVLTNDNYNGGADGSATTSNVNISVTTPATPAYAGAPVPSINTATGAVSLPPNTPAGSYTITYQICDKSGSPCDPATVTVTVAAPTIDAVNGTQSVSAGTTGTTSVLANDTYNGGAAGSATLANVNLTQTATTNAGVTLNTTTGMITVAAGTPAGTYVVTYQICDKINPGVCDTATETVNVAATYCYKLPVVTAGTAVPSNHGITALGRAGADNSNWPMVRQSAWTVLEAKTKGFVVNRVANPATDIANPVEGMMVFDTTAQCLKIYNGTVWSCYSTPACP